MNNFFSQALMVATLADVLTAKDLQSAPSTCCTIYNNKNFRGRGEHVCLEEGAKQSTHIVNLDGHAKKKNKDHSIRCGSRVDATICPGRATIGPVDGQTEMKYTCDSDTDVAVVGT